MSSTVQGPVTLIYVIQLFRTPLKFSEDELKSDMMKKFFGGTNSFAFEDFAEIITRGTFQDLTCLFLCMSL